MAEQPKIVIDPEIANLCRPLTAEEKAQLEENVKRDGCTDPLKLWGDVLLDGHNRYEICTRLNLPFGTEQIDIPDGRAGAVNWVITNQLGRRNLIPEDVSYLRGKRYEVEKTPPEEHAKRAQTAATIAALTARGLSEAAEKVKERHGVDLGAENNTGGRTRTRERVAEEFGVSQDTIQKDAQFAMAIDKIGEKLGKDAANLIRTGKSGLTKRAVVQFAKDEEMTLQKLNDLRFEQERKRERSRKERKKSAPKHGPITQLKKGPNDLSLRDIERMRPFMNAVIQIATTPVTPTTLAGDRWPESWRKQMHESLPPALDYLTAFAKTFNTTQQETSDGNQAKAG